MVCSTLINYFAEFFNPFSLPVNPVCLLWLTGAIYFHKCLTCLVKLFCLILAFSAINQENASYIVGSSGMPKACIN